MRAKDRLGRVGEDVAAAWAGARGWTVLDRNWRCPIGELDLVAQDGRSLVAVEVKTRRSLDYGHPWEAIDAAKLARLHAMVRLWAREHDATGPFRVDALAVVGSTADRMRCEYLRAVA